jgi:DNA-binding XRE family transcriptional regulator
MTDNTSPLALRTALGLTQEQMAARLGLGEKAGRNTIRDWESGKRKIPGPVQIAINSIAAEAGMGIEAETTQPKPKKNRRKTMKKKLATCLALIGTCALLMGCATPETMLRNPKTGQVARCGGNVAASFAGGVIGYHAQKAQDSSCVSSYTQQGFKIDTVTP